MSQEEISLNELKRLCFCNSQRLHENVFILNGIVHEWLGFGWIATTEVPDPEVHVTVVED